MKGRIAISVSAIVFSMLISGCVSVKPYFLSTNLTGSKNFYNRGYKLPGDIHFMPSSETYSESNNSLINIKKGSMKLSISFPPSATLEF